MPCDAAINYLMPAHASLNKESAGILVDEQFGEAILRDARKQGFITACPAEKSGHIALVHETPETRWQVNQQQQQPQPRD